MFNNVYRGKKVLVTGNTGFKGSWLSVWLRMLGADVVGVSDSVPTQPSNFVVSHLQSSINYYPADICDVTKIKSIIEDESPDFIFHLAAQALVRPSYESPINTIRTNAIGSAVILDAVRNSKKQVIVIMVTSDKVYKNVEWNWGYRENDPLGGKDPYSGSKGMAELVIYSYVKSFFSGPDCKVRLGITRAGNVIGGGDWAIDRIVPDCVRAWSNNEVVDVRQPMATRPWQHVLEPLSGYLLLGQMLFEDPAQHGEAYNFGPSGNENYPVKLLIEEMAKHWVNVQWNDISEKGEHLPEAGLLKLNCDKALAELNWTPTMGFEDTVRMTAEWYKKYYQSPSESMHEFTTFQINEYIDIAKAKRIEWASSLSR